MRYAVKSIVLSVSLSSVHMYSCSYNFAEAYHLELNLKRDDALVRQPFNFDPPKVDGKPRRSSESDT